MGDADAATNGGGMAGANNDDDRKLFVGGLAQEVDENDLKEYFGQYGQVKAATLKMDQMTGRSRGFAFVVFEDVNALDGVLNSEHTIKNKKVAVKKAASKQGKIYVGKFSGPITDDEIKGHFEQFGNVVEIQRPVDRSKNSEPKNFCFITYDKEETANSLLAKGKQNIKGQEVEIKKVTFKAETGMRGAGGMRGGMGGGRGGGWGGQGGYDSWGYGPQGGWGYEAPPGPWPGYGGGYGGGWGSGWGGDGSYGGGGKMGGGGQGGQGGFRGRGRGGRSAPY